MKKCLCILVVSCLFVFKASNANEFKNSVGVGLQYGGAVGWQGAFTSQNGVARLGLGVVGVSVGYDKSISNNLSIGVQAFGNLYNQGGGASINYYLGGIGSYGWMLGLDVFRAKEQLEEVVGEVEPNKYENGAFLSFGYHF